jgi:hypothetical protein
MKIKRENKLQIVPDSGFEQEETPVAETPVTDPFKDRLPAVYYADRDGHNKSPQDYRQIREMREQSGGQLGTERGNSRQEAPRQQRINEEAKAQTEKLNSTGYL